MSADLDIRNARLHGRDDLVDLVVRDGRIATIAPGVTALGRPGVPVLDAAGGLVSRSFVEPHYHPDKAYSRALAPDPDADPFARSTAIKAGFTADDVADRAERALRLAVLNGVTAMRVTADVDSVVGLRAVEGLLEACRRVDHLVDTDVVAFPQEGLLRDPGAEALLAQAVGLGARYVGGWPNVEDGLDAQREHVRRVFDLAERQGVGVDLHVDCWISPDEVMLEVVAAETIARGLQGQVLVSHCCGLEVYDDVRAKRVVELVAEADLRVVAIPLNLVDGGPRGLSRPVELLAAGVTVALGSDNMSDGWYPLGTLDPLDRGQLGYLGIGFHEDADVDTVWEMITTSAAVAIGREPGEIAAGAAADLVVLSAPDRAHALARLPGTLTTVRGGQVVARRDLQVVVGETPEDAA
ncbi:amidohydrolase family protein [Nocardioides ginsengisoli]|uniref:Amidohydrolase family protein n=1 Tax=Nocardioides ginsengisoli TaxID=363868 RepID=A0ABW3W8U7_9ACTN